MKRFYRFSPIRNPGLMLAPCLAVAIIRVVYKEWMKGNKEIFNLELTSFQLKNRVLLGWRNIKESPGSFAWAFHQGGKSVPFCSCYDTRAFRVSKSSRYTNHIYNSGGKFRRL
jgi:hypothetical protein